MEDTKKLKLNLIRGVAVILIFWYSIFWQYLAVFLLHIDSNNLTNTTQVLLSTFASIMTMILLILIYRKDLKKDFSKFKKDFGSYLDIGFKYWFIGLSVMLISNFILNFVFKTGGANNEKAVQEMINTIPAVMLLTAGFIGPFNEEIVFRKTLKDIFKNKWLFALVSFILFGGAHVVSSATCLLDYLYIIPYGALGASFALADYEADNVWPSIVMHMMHNTILVLISILTLLK